MKTVHILGAGADVPFGVPLADGLLGALNDFTQGDGASLGKILRRKLGRFQFGFEKYASDQGEGFAERVLHDPKLTADLGAALSKIPDDDEGLLGAVREMLSRLDQIREANMLNAETSATFAGAAGEGEEMADESLLRLRGITLSPMPRNAMVTVFRNACSTPGLVGDERDAIQRVVSLMTNFEDLLTELFAGFYTGHASNQRKYLYVSWLLWAFMRMRSFEPHVTRAKHSSFYDRLDNLSNDDSLITFNYTRFDSCPPDRVVRFHGDCTGYIRYDRGELMTTDSIATNIASIDDIERFVEGLDIDISAGRIFMPAIIPPATLKPVLNSHFVKLWSDAAEVLNDADLLVGVGFSFNPVDRHFNDLFRKAAGQKRTAILNPDLDGTTAAICALLGQDPQALSSIEFQGHSARRSDQLLIVAVPSEEVSAALLDTIRSGW
ncbi:MAG: hypothetical protein F4Y94_11895 [Chloroflexi bacterium]|nr:hypothetical protein [Chloroflexota bacterium]